jgi:hypothetical protein
MSVPGAMRLGGRLMVVHLGPVPVESIRQSSMITRASSSESNCHRLNSSSRNVLLNDSTQGFCQGEPGSMNTLSQSLNRYQSATA